MANVAGSASTPEFEEVKQRTEGGHSYFGRLAGMRIDRKAPGEAWSSMPYRPEFVGYADTGVLHGGVVTTLLDETCGMAVELALDGRTPIATLDLRIDYQRASTPGMELKGHARCYSISRSIAFVRATAYEDDENNPVATATGCFMINSNRMDAAKVDTSAFQELVSLDTPDDPSSPFAVSPFARCLGIDALDSGIAIMRFSKRIIGNTYLPAIHGGLMGAFLETAAIHKMRSELEVIAQPKPIGLTVNYLRSGRPIDTYASVSIVRQGRRVVAFDARAWQDDPTKPVASAYGHFMLRQVPEGDAG